MKFFPRSLGILIFVFFPILVFAGYSYETLSPIKMPDGKPLYSPNFFEYLKNIYTFAIAVAGGLAVIKIIYGGVLYMLSDVVTNKADAKKEIWAAVVGLLLALGSATLLYTIDPNLLRLKFNIESTKPIVGDGRGMFVDINGNTVPGGRADAVGSPSGGGGTLANNSLLVQNPDGTYSMVTSRLALNTDGVDNPGVGASTHQSRTAYADGRLSTYDNYVTVPDNSSIRLGTEVIITNPATGQRVTAIVGDHGGSQGYGEVSMGVATSFNIYPGGDAINSLPLQFNYTNKPLSTIPRTKK